MLCCWKLWNKTCAHCCIEAFWAYQKRCWANTKLSVDLLFGSVKVWLHPNKQSSKRTNKETPSISIYRCLLINKSGPPLHLISTWNKIWWGLLSMHNLQKFMRENRSKQNLSLLRFSGLILSQSCCTLQQKDFGRTLWSPFPSWRDEHCCSWFILISSLAGIAVPKHHQLHWKSHKLNYTLGLILVQNLPRLRNLLPCCSW